jgi:CMP-N-acetylneuraminic acid synthetase
LLKLGVIGRCIVSTDCEEIAEVAREYGGDVPFLRPKELATDTAKSTGYLQHAIEFMASAGAQYDAVLLLQPTSPIRNASEIAEAIDRFIASGADSLISCYQEDYINDLVMYYEDGDGVLKPKVHDHNKGVRRQDHGVVLVRNGAVYITRTEYFQRTGLIVSDRPLLMRMSKRDSIDVDCQDDLELLRAVLCR